MTFSFLDSLILAGESGHTRFHTLSHTYTQVHFQLTVSIEMESVLPSLGIEYALNDFLLSRQPHLSWRIWSVEVVFEPLRHANCRFHQSREVGNILRPVNVLQRK